MVRFPGRHLYQVFATLYRFPIPRFMLRCLVTHQLHRQTQPIRKISQWRLDHTIINLL